jgi:hypothetical protein
MHEFNTQAASAGLKTISSGLLWSFINHCFGSPECHHLQSLCYQQKLDKETSIVGKHVLAKNMV